jgi:hypothetical protein
MAVVKFAQQIIKRIKDGWRLCRVVRSGANLVEVMDKLNPYPETVFTEPTKEEYELMKKAFKEYGLIPDRFFGSWGRTVWNNCVNDLKDILEPED